MKTINKTARTGRLKIKEIMLKNLIQQTGGDMTNFNKSERKADTIVLSPGSHNTHSYNKRGSVSELRMKAVPAECSRNDPNGNFQSVGQTSFRANISQDSFKKASPEAKEWQYSTNYKNPKGG